MKTLPCLFLTPVLTTVLALPLAGCDERANAAPPNASHPETPAVDAALPLPPSSGAPPRATARPSATASSGANTGLQVLKVSFTSEVKNREPVDKLDHAEPGQRVWVHLTIRNRTEGTRPLTVAFRVNDDERSKVDLKVEESWSYRTWAYNTLRASDTTGQLSVDVRDESGALVTSVGIPITKPGQGPGSIKKP